MTRLFQFVFAAFHSRNIESALFVPGCLAGGFSLLMGGLFVIGLFLLWQSQEWPLHGVLGMGCLTALLPVGLAGSLFLAILFAGYQWRLTGIFQTQGFQGQAPPWGKGEWQKSFVAGLHLACYGCMVLFVVALAAETISTFTGFHAHAAQLEAPLAHDFDLVIYTDPETVYPLLVESFTWTLITGGLALIMILPFLLGPVFYNARSLSLPSILVNLLPSWRWTCTRYLPVMAVSLGVLVLVCIPLAITGIVLSLTVVGLLAVPFLLISALLVICNLYLLAFSGPPDSCCPDELP